MFAKTFLKQNSCVMKLLFSFMGVCGESGGSLQALQGTERCDVVSGRIS